MAVSTTRRASTARTAPPPGEPRARHASTKPPRPSRCRQSPRRPRLAAPRRRAARLAPAPSRSCESGATSAGPAAATRTWAAATPEPLPATLHPQRWHALPRAITRHTRLAVGGVFQFKRFTENRPFLTLYQLTPRLNAFLHALVHQSTRRRKRNRQPDGKAAVLAVANSQQARRESQTRMDAHRAGNSTAHTRSASRLGRRRSRRARRSLQLRVRSPEADRVPPVSARRPARLTKHPNGFAVGGVFQFEYFTNVCYIFRSPHSSGTFTQDTSCPSHPKPQPSSTPAALPCSSSSRSPSRTTRSRT